MTIVFLNIFFKNSQIQQENRETLLIYFGYIKRQRYFIIDSEISLAMVEDLS